MVGFDVPRDIFVHICGTDLIRDETGRYLVLEDNARCRSGASYLLENREIMKKTFPRTYQTMSVRSVEAYPELLLRSLEFLSPRQSQKPVCVLLTPGVYNKRYFEHTFLARQMGIEIVEGKDLIAIDGHVYMRTTHGLVQVDIYRRLDDAFLDPLFFEEDSLLGVSGLMDAYLKGNVALANGIGTGVVDDKVTYAYVPEMIRFYLGQDPILEQVPTYLCWNDQDRDYVLNNLSELVVKSANESTRLWHRVVGGASTKKERGVCSNDPILTPDYIAQPIISLSRHTPPFARMESRARRADLRPFILYGEDIEIVPGGLTQVALKKGSLVVNSSQGGGSKDTWVLKG